jgi:hypothetical protein
MIEMLSGTSAGWPTELKTMNSPRRSIFASIEIFIGGFIATSPSPCHSPISGWKSFIVGLLTILKRPISPGLVGRLWARDRVGHVEKGARHSMH